MNKKIVMVILVVLLIIGFICGIAVGLSRKNNIEKYGAWITDNEYLYDKAIEYLKEEEYQNEYNKDKDKEDYQIFIDYKGFGIKEKDNKKYAYMYILQESYYVKNGKLRGSTASCIPYKFTFENDEVVGYEVPDDGTNNTASIKNLFPDDIEDKVVGYMFDNTNLRNNVTKHYSYLESTEIVYIDNDENPIVVYGVYGGYTTKADANTIKGRYIDGYGNIYEYTIPCDENEELLVNIDDIDKSTIIKYAGNKISSISTEDLNTIKENIYNVKEEYDENVGIVMEDSPSSFVKVSYYKNDLTPVDYDRSDLTDLITYTSSSGRNNTSEASNNIIKILSKYNLVYLYD
jgi:hypothetical protein